MSKKNYGHCALCGKYARLSFEHIPPRAAFNSTPRKMITGETAFQTVSGERKPWDMTDLPYKNQQRGMGRSSLCTECNSLTGTLYGDEYKKLAHSFHSLLQDTKAPPNSLIHIEKSLIRPLPIIKQVCSMFCSINKGIKDMDKLGAFVLDKDSHDFPKERFRVGMYLMCGGLARHVAVSAICYTGGLEVKLILFQRSQLIQWVLYSIWILIRKQRCHVQILLILQTTIMRKPVIWKWFSLFMNVISYSR